MCVADAAPDRLPVSQPASIKEERMMQLKTLLPAMLLALLGTTALAGPVNVNTADARTLEINRRNIRFEDSP